MKIVAAVFADFQTAPLGGPSQLGAPLAGQPLLVHTLRRLAHVEGLDGRYLVVQPRDEPAARELLAAHAPAGIELLPIDSGQRPRRELLTAARVWNPSAWRGTPLGTTWFDEFVEPVEVGRVLEATGAEAALCLDGHQPLLDVPISSAMVQHMRDQTNTAKMVFTQAPPGLAGIVLSRRQIAELLELTCPLGILLSYRPELVRLDPITSDNCLHLPMPVVTAAARLTGDTRRSRELLEELIAALGPQCDATAVCRWIHEHRPHEREPLPVEIELELTTRTPLPGTTLRPAGERVPTRELSDLEAVARLAAELAAWDDRRVVLAGFGDPLLHPQFGEICGILRDAGIRALGVVTPLVELSETHIETLLTTPVDLIEVQLDAHSRETYHQLTGRDAFEQVVANVERFYTLRQQRVCPRPLVACSLTRCAATIDELDPFYDHWIRRTGLAVLRGYHRFGGALPADSLIPMTPPVRTACRRLASRLTLLADGAAVACDQDFAATQPLGDWRQQSLHEIWHGPRRADLLESHRRGCWDDHPLCARCDAWHEP